MTESRVGLTHHEARRAGAQGARGKFNGRSSGVHRLTPLYLTLCPCPASIAEPALIAFILFCFVALLFHQSAVAASRRNPAVAPGPVRRPGPAVSRHVPGVPGCSRPLPNIRVGGTRRRRVPPFYRSHPLLHGLRPCALFLLAHVSRERYDRQCTSAVEYVLA